MSRMTHFQTPSETPTYAGAGGPTSKIDAPLVLEVRNLSVDFVSPAQPPAHALANVSFTLREGEMLGVVGESGCGKTTLMLSLMRLLAPAGRIIDGQVIFREHDLLSLSEPEMTRVRWKNISMIFQGAMNALNPVRRVGEQIAEAIRQHYPVSDKATLDQRVSELFDMVGIAPERKHQYPHQFSGGMRQRAMIAMAMACAPQVVIADEPTTALDVMMAEVCDTVLVMYGGVVAEYADVDTIFNHPQHPYTQELLKAFPDLSQPTDKLVSIPGYPPRLNALPPGCRFAPRCPAVFDRCHTAQPPRYQLTPHHSASCYLVEPT
jgi:peptide/nickel transport system ATP-binding protein